MDQNPKEWLQEFGSKEKIPVPIGDQTFMARTRLTVEDVMALPMNMMQMHPAAQALVIARLLLLAPNGMPLFNEGEDDSWFNKADGFAIAKAIMDSGLMLKALGQLERKEEPSSGKKSVSENPSET